MSEVVYRRSTSLLGKRLLSPPAVDSKFVATKKRKVQEELGSMVSSSVEDSTVDATKFMDPLEFVLAVIKASNGDATIRPSTDEDIFEDPTEEQIAAYDHEVVRAIQAQDVAALREMHKNGRPLQCCNRFGESLLHMACRRGFSKVVTFLMEEAKVSVYVKDDYGRTPMHDACWASTPQYEIMEKLIRAAPELLTLSDARGFAPFSYARKDHWEGWMSFLAKRKHMLRTRPAEVSSSEEEEESCDHRHNHI